MYTTVEDMRAEGVTAAQASDERLTALIEEASRMIDRATGWFFEPRELTYHLDGRGTPTIELPAPLIRLDQLLIDGSEVVVTFENPIVIGAPVQSGFYAPHITFRYGRRFPRGRSNVETSGVWGYTEHDGTFMGRTPLEIRRACMMIVLRLLPSLADTDATDEARNRWRVVEERTRDQSYKLNPAQRGSFTGDPDIDHILLSYRRPAAMGAV
jgi:hypothetical protein